MPNEQPDLSAAQRRHWQDAYRAHPDMYGSAPSTAAVYAANVFKAAVFGHMALCMALSTNEIHTIVNEVRRVLRPGGVFVYTVRHIGDAHYGAGNACGDNTFEHGGFAVHFFSRQLVDALAKGWIFQDVYAFEEGELPRRLWRVTTTKSR